MAEGGASGRGDGHVDGHGAGGEGARGLPGRLGRLFEASAPGGPDGARALDLVTLGRVGMDLYAREPDVDFAEVSGFDKGIGGSPGLIAIGAAALGLRAGIVSRVSDDVVGRYVTDDLARRGIDVSGVATDSSGTRTSLALTELRAEGCAVVIYRNDAADLALTAADVDASRIGEARALAVSGTALSREPSRSAALRAVQLAADAGTAVVLDLDYRAYTWASVAEAGEVYAALAPRADVLIGNREEFAVLGIPESASAREVGARCLVGETSTVLVKAGADGSEVFTIDGDAFAQAPFAVDTVKPFGAGDAYAAATIAGLVEGRSLRESVRRGAAAAAIVVSSRACADAMPDAAALDAFLAARAAPSSPPTDAVRP